MDGVGGGRIRIKSFGVSTVGGIQDDKVHACGHKATKPAAALALIGRTGG